MSFNFELGLQDVVSCYDSSLSIGFKSTRGKGIHEAGETISSQEGKVM